MTTTITCPAGTTGIAVEPWTRGEIYAVAANWAQASGPIYTYGRHGWTPNGRQVADYRHRAKDALRAEIIEAIVDDGDVDDDEVDAILSDAVEIADED